MGRKKGEGVVGMRGGEREMEKYHVYFLIFIYDTIQKTYEYHYSGVNPVEFRGRSKRFIIINIVKKVKIEINK